jgi:hypothetical protein
MSELPMRGHFRYLRFKTFPMTPRTPRCEVFCPLLSSSEHSGVSEDSQPPTFPSVGLHPHTWPKWGCDTSQLGFGEVTTFPLIILSMISHRGYIQMSFCPRIPKLGVSKFWKLGFLALWRAIISYANLRLKWGPKQSCSPCWKISNSMCHTTCTHIFHGDSWILVGMSQIGTLIPDPSFGYNLCFKYSNGSCEPILDIYISRSFQWYKELFNTISFGLWNIYLKIWDSIGIQIPKVRVHLGVCGFILSHS